MTLKARVEPVVYRVAVDEVHERLSNPGFVLNAAEQESRNTPGQVRVLLRASVDQFDAGWPDLEEILKHSATHRVIGLLDGWSEIATDSVLTQFSSVPVVWAQDAATTLWNPHVGCHAFGNTENGPSNLAALERLFCEPAIFDRVWTLMTRDHYGAAFPSLAIVDAPGLGGHATGEIVDVALAKLVGPGRKPMPSPTWMRSRIEQALHAAAPKWVTSRQSLVGTCRAISGQLLQDLEDAADEIDPSMRVSAAVSAVDKANCDLDVHSDSISSSLREMTRSEAVSPWSSDVALSLVGAIPQPSQDLNECAAAVVRQVLHPSVGNLEVAVQALVEMASIAELLDSASTAELSEKPVLVVESLPVRYGWGRAIPFLAAAAIVLIIGLPLVAVLVALLGLGIFGRHSTAAAYTLRVDQWLAGLNSSVGIADGWALRCEDVVADELRSLWIVERAVELGEVLRCLAAILHLLGENPLSDWSDDEGETAERSLLYEYASEHSSSSELADLVEAAASDALPKVLADALLSRISAVDIKTADLLLRGIEVERSTMRRESPPELDEWQFVRTHRRPPARENVDDGAPSLTDEERLALARHNLTEPVGEAQLINHGLSALVDVAIHALRDYRVRAVAGGMEVDDPAFADLATRSDIDGILTDLLFDEAPLATFVRPDGLTEIERSRPSLAVPFAPFPLTCPRTVEVSQLSGLLRLHASSLVAEASTSVDIAALADRAFPDAPIVRQQNLWVSVPAGGSQRFLERLAEHQACDLARSTELVIATDLADPEVVCLRVPWGSEHVPFELAGFGRRLGFSMAVYQQEGGGGYMLEVRICRDAGLAL